MHSELGPGQSPQEKRETGHASQSIAVLTCPATEPFPVVTVPFRRLKPTSSDGQELLGSGHQRPEQRITEDKDPGKHGASC